MLGVFIPTTSVSLIGFPISYEIVRFAANENVTSATAIVMFNATSFSAIVPVTIDTFITWNAEGQITQYVDLDQLPPPYVSPLYSVYRELPEPASMNRVLILDRPVRHNTMRHFAGPHIFWTLINSAQHQWDNPQQAVAYLSKILANSVCTTHQTYCNGANQQYEDLAACTEFLLNEIRFGEAYELGMNT